MTDAAINSLGTIAAETAMRGAAEYVRSNKLSIADYDAATACIKRHCKAAVGKALNDARDALTCGMSQIAETTFKASMTIAGIEAMKEYFAS